MKKKKILAVLSAAMMSVGIILTSGVPVQATEVGSSDEIIANDETGIPDVNLYQAALETFDSNKDGVLTKDEAAVTTLFVADNRNIQSLQGIQFFSNVYGLSLSGNSISDISVLSGLSNLFWLYLDNNQISDISALSKMTDLEYLYLDNNQISSISALSGMAKLETLNSHLRYF